MFYMLLLQYKSETEILVKKIVFKLFSCLWIGELCNIDTVIESTFELNRAEYNDTIILCRAALQVK